MGTNMGREDKNAGSKLHKHGEMRGCKRGVNRVNAKMRVRRSEEAKRP